MRITESQLRRIIREEVRGQLTGAGGSYSEYGARSRGGIADRGGGYVIRESDQALDPEVVAFMQSLTQQRIDLASPEAADLLQDFAMEVGVDPEDLINAMYQTMPSRKRAINMLHSHIDPGVNPRPGPLNPIYYIR